MVHPGPVDDGETVVLSNKKDFKVITKEGFVRNLTVLFRQIDLLQPGVQIALIVLCDTAIEAGFTSNEQKKNQVIPI